MKKILLIALFLTAVTSQASEINTLESSDETSYPKITYDSNENIYRIKFRDSPSSIENESQDVNQSHIGKALLELETRQKNDAEMTEKRQEFIKTMKLKQQQDIEDMRERTQEYMRTLDKQSQERERKARELAKKPNAKIGMTKKQVLNNTNWGEPNGVRTFTTAKGTREVWSYNNYKYLYFDNGKLIMIEQ
ncbi:MULTISPECIES: hypothetical protein [Psychrobacter]|uniref:hypothetical protein n=1 Tax=Psychrobacter TaxID=497 RepID=UPI00146CCB46|nr:MULTISPECIES: hypothetical protein [Psychrobacter]